MNKKLNQKIDLSKTLGCVVEYKGQKFLFWHVNSSGMAQLIKPDGTKFTGTPNINKLTWLYQVPLVYFNRCNYVVDIKQRIISLASGKICSFTPSINEKLRKEAAESPIVTLRVHFDMGLITWSEFYLQSMSAVFDYIKQTNNPEQEIVF